MIKGYGLHILTIGMVGLVGLVINLYKRLHKDTMHNMYKLYIMHH